MENEENEENIYRRSNYITSIERGEVNAPNRNNTEHHKKKRQQLKFFGQNTTSEGRKKPEKRNSSKTHTQYIYILKRLHSNLEHETQTQDR